MNIAPVAPVAPVAPSEETGRPVPPPSAMGAPGSEPQKRNRKPKSDYPGLFDASGVGIKLTAVPTDFNPKIHNPLSKKDFDSEATYIEHCASVFEGKAKALRVQAEKLRALGNTASAGKVKTLLKMQERMKELMATLKAEGMDIDAMLAGNTVE